MRGEYALHEDQGTLLLSSCEKYDAATHMVNCVQFYEVFDRNGVVLWKRYFGTAFCLHSKTSFESLAEARGFRVMALYGDYDRAAFQPQTSPYMIWVLRKR